ncbi:MAG: phosphatase PAP2 family protein [Phycisphaerales bacterium]
MPIRWLHVGATALSLPRVWRWSGDERRRAWARPLLIGAVATAIVLPIDEFVVRRAARVWASFGGDIKRELEAIQQYGQFTAILLIALVIWLQDLVRRERLRVLVPVMLAAAALVYPAKLLVGRPRPKLDDPWHFLGPLGTYPTSRGMMHAWEFWAKGASEIWSMPSSHTTYAVAFSLFLAWMYPRLRTLVLVLAGVVGVCRVLTGAHYPSDVVVGAALGAIAAGVVLRRAGAAPRAEAVSASGRSA